MRGGDIGPHRTSNNNNSAFINKLRFRCTVTSQLDINFFQLCTFFHVPSFEFGFNVIFNTEVLKLVSVIIVCSCRTLPTQMADWKANDHLLRNKKSFVFNTEFIFPILRLHICIRIAFTTVSLLRKDSPSFTTFFFCCCSSSHCSRCLSMVVRFLLHLVQSRRIAVSVKGHTGCQYR